MAEVLQSVENELRPPVEADIRRPVDRVEYRPAAIRRISWGAALAGVVIALVAQLVLSLLGVGVGMSAIDPLTEDTPSAEVFGTAAGLWWIASWCMALLLGGWAAGRLAGMPRRLDAALHGVLTWAFATLILFYLLTTAVGNLIGGEFRTLSTVLATSGPGMAPAVPGLDRPWGSIRHESETLLRQTGNALSHPDPLAETAHRTSELSGAADQKALQAADATAKTVSQASLWTVVALVLGVIAAGIGGALGTPRDLPAAVVREA